MRSCTGRTASSATLRAKAPRSWACAMRVSRRPRQYLALMSKASTGDLADRRSRHAAKPASASSLATSSIFRLALVAPSRAWTNWVLSSAEAVCAALLICSKPSAALRTPIWANSRTRSLAALVVSVACSMTLSSGLLVVMGQVLGWVVLGKLLLGDGAYMGALWCVATSIVALRGEKSQIHIF